MITSLLKMRGHIVIFSAIWVSGGIEMSWKDAFPKENRYYETERGILYCGDAMDILKLLSEGIVDTVITDPPYGLSEHSERIIREVLKEWLNGGESYVPETKGFMGHKWDAFVPPPALWREVLRVMKHGATAFIFAGTRTQDLMSISLRLAGFQLKDVLMWLYGNGFPKAQDIGAMMDKKIPNDIGKKWKGYKTHSLKPAYEPIIMAIKSNEGSYVNNALKYGVAGLNIDDARIPLKSGEVKRGGFGNAMVGYTKGVGLGSSPEYSTKWVENREGRYPANIVLDEESARMLDKQTGVLKSGYMSPEKHKRNKTAGKYQSPHGIYGVWNNDSLNETYGDKGGASRFFYVTKVKNSERIIDNSVVNNHPTVKPFKLIEYLVKLTLMPNPKQIYLDPFIGSGTTAVVLEHYNRYWIGMEIEPSYCEITKARLKKVANQSRITDFGGD